MIKEITGSKQPISDGYGRVTFFYIILGGEVLPVYQAGTIMFESAVLDSSDVAIFSKGVQ